MKIHKKRICIFRCIVNCNKELEKNKGPASEKKKKRFQLIEQSSIVGVVLIVVMN